MKIQLLKENLLQAIQTVTKFTTQKNQLPILSHVAIQAEEQGIYFSGTDLEMGIRLRVGGKVVEPGEVGVPAKLLSDLTGALPLGAVELSADVSGMMEIKAARSRAKIQGLKLNDFPAVLAPKDGGVEVGSFDVQRLLEILGRVEFAISRDEARPVLTGILWDFSMKRWVGTDGYRLSVVEGEMAGVPVKDLPGSLIVSGRYLNEAVKVAGELGLKKVALKYAADTKQIYLVAEDVTVVGRVLTGDYPKYEAILPTEFKVVATVDKGEMAAAVKAAAIFAQDSAHIIRLAFGDKKITVSANAPQVGENQVEVEAIFEKPGELMMAFNSRYMVDFLGHATTERIVLGVNDPLKAGVFRGEGQEGYRHVIMPVRVRDGEG
jgi:DNA polymerase III subunit beta